MHIIKIVICMILMGFIPVKSSDAQKILNKTTKVVEIGTSLSTSGFTPFWIRNNQNGESPLQSNYVYASGGISKSYDSTYTVEKKLNNIDFGYGARLVAITGNVNRIVFSELYFQSRFKKVDLTLGRKNKVYGLVDSTLTSGSLIYSGNSLPIPSISFSIPEFIPLLGRGLFSIKGSFSHGWFGSETFTRGFYLHEKSLYGKFGKESWRINFQSGFNNQVLWGGYSEILKDNALATYQGHLPSDFNAFLSSAFPFKFIKKNFPPEYSIWFDEVNYSGNMLGSLDFAIQIKSKKGIFFIYRQIPYELGSLFSSLVNADDGLYGISYNYDNKAIIKKITFEGFHSYNQGSYRSGIATLFNVTDKHFGELHNYFNHGQYLDGWSYRERSIGTPIIIGNNEINLNKFGTNSWERSSFSQVKLIFLGLHGVYKNIDFITKLSYGKYRRTQGYYLANNFDVHQFCSSLQASKKIKLGYALNSKIGFDNSGVLIKSLGFQFGIKKEWM